MQALSPHVHDLPRPWVISVEPAWRDSKTSFAPGLTWSCVKICTGFSVVYFTLRGLYATGIREFILS